MIWRLNDQAIIAKRHLSPERKIFSPSLSLSLSPSYTPSFSSLSHFCPPPTSCEQQADWVKKKALQQLNGRERESEKEMVALAVKKRVLDDGVPSTLQQLFA